MKYSVVYSVGSYDYEIEDDIPTLALANAVITGLQPYHDKTLQVKPLNEVRKARLRVSGELLYDLVIDTPNEK